MLENEGLESLAGGYGVCPECYKRIISAIFQEINHQIKVVELDFYQRQMLTRQILKHQDETQISGKGFQGWVFGCPYKR